MTFPHTEETDLKGSLSEETPTTPAKKVLPDRTRAARDKANEKIVEFIVKTKGADEHLQAILTSQKPSRWLKGFLHPTPCVMLIETYLEDEGQQELVVNHLEKVYQEAAAKPLPLFNGESVILDVLFPEVKEESSWRRPEPAFWCNATALSSRNLPIIILSPFKALPITLSCCLPNNGREPVPDSLFVPSSSAWPYHREGCGFWASF